jgi:hypothetical protein
LTGNSRLTWPRVVLDMRVMPWAIGVRLQLALWLAVRAICGDSFAIHGQLHRRVVVGCILDANLIVGGFVQLHALWLATRIVSNSR